MRKLGVVHKQVEGYLTRCAHCRVDLSEWHNGDSVTSCRGYVVTKVGNGIELLWQLKNIVGVGHKIRKLLSYVIYNTQHGGNGFLKKIFSSMGPILLGASYKPSLGRSLTTHY